LIIYSNYSCILTLHLRTNPRQYLSNISYYTHTNQTYQFVRFYYKLFEKRITIYAFFFYFRIHLSKLYHTTIKQHSNETTKHKYTQHIILISILLILSFFILSNIYHILFTNPTEPFETNNRSILAECEQYKAAASDVIQRQQELDEREQQISLKETELQEQIDSLERQQQVVSDESKSNSSLSTNLSNAQAEIKRSKQTILTLKNEIQELQSMQQSSSNDSKQKETRIKQMQSHIDSIDQAYSNQLQTLERERQALGEQRISLQDTQSNLQSAYQTRSSEFTKDTSL